MDVKTNQLLFLIWEHFIKPIEWMTNGYTTVGLFKSISIVFEQKQRQIQKAILQDDITKDSKDMQLIESVIYGNKVEDHLQRKYQKRFSELQYPYRCSSHLGEYKNKIVLKPTFGIMCQKCVDEEYSKQEVVFLTKAAYATEEKKRIADIITGVRKLEPLNLGLKEVEDKIVCQVKKQMTSVKKSLCMIVENFENRLKELINQDIYSEDYVKREPCQNLKKQLERNRSILYNLLIEARDVIVRKIDAQLQKQLEKHLRIGYFYSKHDCRKIVDSMFKAIQNQKPKSPESYNKPQTLLDSPEKTNQQNNCNLVGETLKERKDSEQKNKEQFIKFQTAPAFIVPSNSNIPIKIISDEQEVKLRSQSKIEVQFRVLKKEFYDLQKQLLDKERQLEQSKIQKAEEKKWYQKQVSKLEDEVSKLTQICDSNRRVRPVFIDTSSDAQRQQQINVHKREKAACEKELKDEQNKAQLLKGWLESRTREHDQQMQAIKATNDCLKDMINSQKQTISQREQQIKELKSLNESYQKAMAASSLQSKDTELAKQLLVAKSEIQELRKIKREQDKQIAQFSRQKQVYTDRFQGLEIRERNNQDLQKRVYNLQKQLEEQKVAFTKKIQELNIKQKQISLKDAEIQKLMTQADSRRAQISRLESTIQQNNSRISELQELNKKHETELKDITEVHKTMEKQLNQIRQLHMTVSTQFRNAELELERRPNNSIMLNSGIIECAEEKWALQLLHKHMQFNIKKIKLLYDRSQHNEAPTSQRFRGLRNLFFIARTRNDREFTFGGYCPVAYGTNERDKDMKTCIFSFNNRLMIRMVKEPEDEVTNCMRDYWFAMNRVCYLNDKGVNSLLNSANSLYERQEIGKDQIFGGGNGRNTSTIGFEVYEIEFET